MKRKQSEVRIREKNANDYDIDLAHAVSHFTHECLHSFRTHKSWQKYKQNWFEKSGNASAENMRFK